MAWGLSYYLSIDKPLILLCIIFCTEDAEFCMALNHHFMLTQS